MASAEEWMDMFHGAQGRIQILENRCAALQKNLELAKEMLLATKISPTLVEKILGDK